MAMSGGIDSGVAAWLLRGRGYDVVGATFRNFRPEPSCRTAEAAADPVDDARRLAGVLGIEHHAIDACNLFYDTVIQNFISEYLQGCTPNPCVLCNYVLKWGLMLREADRLNCTHVATGHYARVGRDKGRCFVRCGTDFHKDQSYFLWKLTQEQLRRTVFPLGELTKVRVRQLAESNGLRQLAERKESEEVCFIPGNDYRQFLETEVPDLKRLHPPGDFVSADGRVVGRHGGLYRYTVGQRKGLGLALGEPAYVVSLHAGSNRVVLGRRDDLACREVRVGETNMQKYADFDDGMRVLCKVRYRSRAAEARLYHDGGFVRAVFDSPAYGVAPGQSIVFYEGTDLVGGGVMLRPGG